MNFVALRMLFGDRAKYLALIFAIAFSTFLLENQTSIFAGILKRSGNQVRWCTGSKTSVSASSWTLMRKFPHTNMLTCSPQSVRSAS